MISDATVRATVAIETEPLFITSIPYVDQNVSTALKPIYHKNIEAINNTRLVLSCFVNLWSGLLAASVSANCSPTSISNFISSSTLFSLILTIKIIKETSIKIDVKANGIINKYGLGISVSIFGILNKEII